MDIPNLFIDMARSIRNQTVPPTVGGNVMDETLLRTLQSIKRIEDDPALQFQTEKIDLATFFPKYPNVVVVDQRVDQSQLPLSSTCGDFGILPSGILSPNVVPKLAFITNRLTVALELAFCRTLSNPKFEVTIILKEGLYIDALRRLDNYHGMITEGKWPCRPTVAMEIVGLNDVRFLFDDDSATTFELEFVNLILRNVHVYDYRVDPPLIDSMFHVLGTSYLIGVKLYSPKVAAIEARDQDAKIFLKGCSVITEVFLARYGATVNASDCLLMVRERLECSRESTFIGFNLVFRHDSRLSVTVKSRCVLDRCKFEASNSKQSNSLAFTDTALVAQNESVVECRRTQFLGCLVVAYGAGSGTSACFRNCDIFGSEIPFWAEQNSSISVFDSSIRSSCNVITVTANVNGKVEFLRNQYESPMIVVMDPISNTPTADVELKYVRKEFPVSSEYGSSDKRLSRGSKNMNTLFGSDHGLSRSEWNQLYEKTKGLGVKLCSKCGKFDMDEPELDFRYCGNCRNVCYCSKECQLAHWEDHGLMCKGKKGSKLSDDKSKSKKGTGSRSKGKK